MDHDEHLISVSLVKTSHKHLYMTIWDIFFQQLMQREEANLAFFHFFLPCLEVPGINFHVTSIAAHFQISVLSNNFCLLYAQKIKCNKISQIKDEKIWVQFRFCLWLNTISYAKLYITYHWQKCWETNKKTQIKSTCKTRKNRFIYTLCIKHLNPCEIPG